MKDKKPNSFVALISNFALVLAVIYGLVVIPYAMMKSLFPVGYYLIAIGIILGYITYWVVQNFIRKTQIVI